MKRISIVALCLLLCSCSSVGKTLEYGYLPGGKYKYYAPLTPVDLHGKRYRLKILDNRTENRIECAESTIPRNSELEGQRGYQFFSNYLRAMIERNHGMVDDASQDIIEVKLRAISGDLKMVVYGHVYGLVEFDAKVGKFDKRYCSVMKDGDKNAPVGKFSFSTRKGALRKLVSASTRKALEEFMQDLARIQE